MASRRAGELYGLSVLDEDIQVGWVLALLVCFTLCNAALGLTLRRT